VPAHRPVSAGRLINRIAAGSADGTLGGLSFPRTAPPISRTPKKKKKKRNPKKKTSKNKKHPLEIVVHAHVVDPRSSSCQQRTGRPVAKKSLVQQHSRMRLWSRARSGHLFFLVEPGRSRRLHGEGLTAGCASGKRPRVTMDARCWRSILRSRRASLLFGVGPPGAGPWPHAPPRCRAPKMPKQPSRRAGAVSRRGARCAWLARKH